MALFDPNANPNVPPAWAQRLLDPNKIINQQSVPNFQQSGLQYQPPPPTFAHTHQVTQAGSHTHWIDEFKQRPRFKKKFTRFENALWALRQYDTNIEGTRYFFQKVNLDHMMEHLGYYNPIYRGIPTRFADYLLRGVRAPQPYRADYKQAGLTYMAPAGYRSCAKVRTSLNALTLMDHWAANHPKFQPFLNVFVDDACRREIALTCIDLELGIKPRAYREADEKRKIAMEKEAQEQERKLKEAAAERQRQLAENIQQAQSWQHLVQATGATSGMQSAIRQQQLLFEAQAKSQMNVSSAINNIARQLHDSNMLMQYPSGMAPRLTGKQADMIIMDDIAAPGEDRTTWAKVTSWVKGKLNV